MAPPARIVELAESSILVGTSRASSGPHGTSESTAARLTPRGALAWLGRVVVMAWSYRKTYRELASLSDRDLRDLRAVPSDIGDMAWSEARLRAAEHKRPALIGAAAVTVIALLVATIALIATAPSKAQRPPMTNGRAIEAVLPQMSRLEHPMNDPQPASQSGGPLASAHTPAPTAQL